MKKRTLISLLLALAMVLTLTACGGSKTTAQTVEGQEAVREMVNAFYKDVLTADPIRITTTMGEATSVFTRDGGKMCMEDSASGVNYYAFMEDGVKYVIYDDGIAHADEFMYDMLSQNPEMTMAMFVTGIMEAEGEGDPLTYKATRTDSAKGSELVYVVTGENEGQTVELTVTGKADADGKVTDIDYQAVSGEESQAFTFHFDYEGVTVALPEYTIEPTQVVPEFDHVESPFATIQELIDRLGEDESLSYVTEEGRLYAVGEKDGRYYQVSAPLAQEDQDALDALDFFDDDYQQQVYDIIGKLVIDDCIDYTDGTLSADEISALVGKTVRELQDEGFESNGWSAFEDEVYLSLCKDFMQYSVKVTPDQDFDPEKELELEDFLDFPVEQIEFDSPEPSALPFR